MYTYLCEKFNKDIYCIKRANLIIGKQKINFSYFYSNYHIEIDFTEYSTYEKVIIHSFLLDFIRSLNIAFNIPRIIIIKNAHNITKKHNLLYQVY